MSRALLVDDREDNLYYLQTLLGSDNWQVDCASNGQEALDLAHENPPDLVISDLLMPVMDGFTLLSRWRADPVLHNTPFIVYTATYTDAEDEALALQMGADAFLLKPTAPEVFLERIHGVVAEAAIAPRPLAKNLSEDPARLREYSEALVRKLESKRVEFEEANRRLHIDIARREEVERALRCSEERFHDLADNIDDVFWLSDTRQFLIYYVSPAYEQVYQRSVAEFLADPMLWLDTVHPDDRERVEASLTGYISGSWDETYRIVRPDGAVRWLRARAYPVHDANGAVIRVAGVARDITEVRRLEEQLRHSQKIEAVGQLAGGIAHDFNNLLSVILSYAGLALEDLPADNPLRDDISEIYSAGERATELTQQLLAFSRRQILQPIVLDLSAAVLGVEKMLRRLLREDVELDLHFASTAHICADPGQIEQILMNLAVNAADAMPNGGKLTIEVGEVEVDDEFCAMRQGLEPGTYVTIAITDSGTGMDQATRERIFEPFFTTKAPGQGTGLGLSTVFGIVKQSGGHIDVYSEPGMGTTFKAYFPSTDHDLTAPTPRAPSTSTLRGTETILLIEDDDFVRASHGAILRRHGYTVLDASGGRAALEASASFDSEIDLLITDVVMPGLSGREAADLIATSRPTIKIIYVSGYAQHAIVTHGVLEAGIEFLSKPVTPKVLLRKIREVLASQGVPSD